MLNATMKRLVHNRGRLTLTVFAVALGVALLTGALVLTASTRAAFEGSYAQVYAGVDVIVRPGLDGAPAPGGPGFAPGVLDRIRAARGVAGVDGRRRAIAQLIATEDGDGGVAAIAMDAPTEPEPSVIVVREGRMSTVAGQIAVDEATASAEGLAVGDEVRVVLADAVSSAEIVGVVSFGPLEGLAGGARLILADADASRLLGEGYAEVAAVAAPGVTPQQLAARITQVLNGEATAVTAEEAARRDADQASRQAAVISYIVVMVGAVALLVAALLTANTFAILVAQQARELALLRAVGASGRQVAASMLTEVALTGMFGSVLGLVLGLGAGAALVEVSPGLFAGLPPAAPVVTPLILIAGPMVGTGVAVLAGLGTTRRAMVVSPVEAMRSGTARPARSMRARPIFGLVLLVSGGVGAAVAAAMGARGMIIGSAALSLVGSGLSLPLLTGPVLAVVSLPLASGGIAARLARMQALNAPRRVGATAGAVAIALALLTFLLTIQSSLGAAVPSLMEARQRAEFTVRSTAPQGLHDGLLDIASRAEDIDGVAVASVVTYADLRLVDPDDGARAYPVSAYVTDPGTVDEIFDVVVAAGDQVELDGGGLAVREELLETHGWRIGALVEVTLPDGTRQHVEIAATFTGPIATDLIVAPGLVGSHLAAPYREVFVKLTDDADAGDVERELAAVATSVPSVEVMSRDQQVAETVEENRSSLGILTALFSLAFVVGMLGVANTLSLTIHERRRELGLFRAVGASRSHVKAMLRWEAVLTSVLGAVIGVLVGIAAAWVSVTLLPDPTRIVMPVLHITIPIVATALLGVVASARPARRAATMDVLTALRST